jgi:hypothetical protein
MSIMLPDTDVESTDYEESESGEFQDESETWDEESRSAAERRRRARQRRIALANRRREQARARSMARSRPVPAPARATQQQTAAAIRTLDLETKVQEDAFRAAIAAANRRTTRSEYAVAAGVAANQVVETFDELGNPLLKAAIRFAPLLALSPQRKENGFGAFITDPRWATAAVVGGILIVGENRKRFASARQISVLGPSDLAAGSDDLFVAEVTDIRGQVVDTPVTWASSDSTIATVDPVTGKVTGNAAGVVVITATADGVRRLVRLKIT